MKTVIVTPLYYVDKDLVEIIDNNNDETIVVITDDVSPIFPVDVRMEWLTRSLTTRKNITFDSIVQNDESAEFKQAVTDKVSKLVGIDGYSLHVFITKECHDNNKDLTSAAQTYVLDSPLEVDGNDVFDLVFLTRFGYQFTRFTQPKEKPSKYEYARMIPRFIVGDEEYYGFVVEYPDGKLDGFNVSVERFCPMQTLRITLGAYTEAYLEGSKMAGFMTLGWLDETYYVVDTTAPAWVDVTKQDGLRTFMAIEADIIFIPRSGLKLLGVPLLSWVIQHIENLEQEELERRENDGE